MLKDTHFTMQQLKVTLAFWPQEMGHDFCKTLFEMSNPDRIKYKQAIEDIEALFPENGPNDPEREVKSSANLKSMQ